MLAFGLLAAAVAMDFVEGLHPDHAFNLLTALGETDGARALAASLGVPAADMLVHEVRAVEEATETMAFTLLWAAFLTHAAATLAGLTVRLAPSANQTEEAQAPPPPAPPEVSAPAVFIPDAGIARPASRRRSAARIEAPLAAAPSAPDEVLA